MLLYGLVIAALVWKVFLSAPLRAEGFETAAPEADEPYVAGTFTIQNLGAFGVASAAPIVHTPQACALALGSAVDALAAAN